MADLSRYYDLEENAAQRRAAARDCDERLRTLRSEHNTIVQEIAERERRSERPTRSRGIQMAEGAKGLGGWEEVECDTSPLGILKKQRSELESRIDRLKRAGEAATEAADSAAQLVSNLRQHLRNSGVKV